MRQGKEIEMSATPSRDYTAPYDKNQRRGSCQPVASRDLLIHLTAKCDTFDVEPQALRSVARSKVLVVLPRSLDEMLSDLTHVRP